MKHSRSSARRLVALLAAALGIFLLGVDLRPIADVHGELHMAWSCYRAHSAASLGSSNFSDQPIAAFVQVLRSHLLAWALFALTLSTGLGLATAALLSRRLSRRTSLALRFACICVWLVALDPAIALFVATRDPENAARYVDVGDLFRALGVGALWIAFALWMAKDPSDAAFESSPEPAAARGGVSLFLAMLVAALVPSLLSWIALDRFPLTNDEFAYLFQARLFAHGELAHDWGSLADFFTSPQTQNVGGRIFSVVLPGHSAVLAPGLLLGLPELLPRMLAALSVALTWSLGVRLGIARPLWAAWCLALSPAFLGVESLYLSHASSLPLALLFAWCTLGGLDAARAGATRRAFVLAAFGGLALSLAFVVRPVTALALALPYLVLIVHERPKRSAALVGVALVCAIPAVLWLAWVNRELTGSPFQTAYTQFNRASNATYGAVDLKNAGAIAAFNLSRLSIWSSGLVPGLILPVIGFGLAARRSARMWVLAAAPISLFAFYLLHPFHGVPWVAPVYMTDSLPELALLSAQGLWVVELAFGAQVRRASWIALGLGCALLLWTHFHLAREEIDLRERPYAAARAAGIQRGVVFVRLESQRARRHFPLAPPEPGDPIVFARDLGRRNEELLRSLVDMPAWVYDPVSGKLSPLAR